MNNFRNEEFIIEDEYLEVSPNPCTLSRRKKVPPNLETATCTNELSTIIEIYTQEKKTQYSKVSPQIKMTLHYIRPSNQIIPGLETAQRWYSCTIDEIDSKTARNNLHPRLKKLI